MPLARDSVAIQNYLVVGESARWHIYRKYRCIENFFMRFIFILNFFLFFVKVYLTKMLKIVMVCLPFLKKSIAFWGVAKW